MSLLSMKRGSKLNKSKSKLMNIVKGEKQIAKMTVRLPASVYLDLKTILAAENRVIADVVLSLIINYMKNKNLSK